MLQDDLESERELRQRVNFSDITFLPLAIDFFLEEGSRIREATNAFEVGKRLVEISSSNRGYFGPLGPSRSRISPLCFPESNERKKRTGGSSNVGKGRFSRVKQIGFSVPEIKDLRRPQRHLSMLNQKTRKVFSCRLEKCWSSLQEVWNTCYEIF